MKQTIIDTLTKTITDFEILEGSEQRSVADLIEFRVKSILMGLCDNDLVSKCLEPRSKKSIEDMSIVGKNGVKYYTDTKSHNINSDFSMPNLTSVEKLRKLLEKNNEELIYIFVSYTTSGQNVSIINISVKYVWELSFKMLRIGSLGKGQLQISNMNKELEFTNIGKQTWLDELKSNVRKYHDQRINQIKKDKLKWL